MASEDRSAVTNHWLGCRLTKEIADLTPALERSISWFFVARPLPLFENLRERVVGLRRRIHEISVVEGRLLTRILDATASLFGYEDAIPNTARNLRWDAFLDRLGQLL